MTSAFQPEAAQRLRDQIVRPVFIVSTPRSGSTLLFETLVRAPGLFSVGNESHQRIENVADFFPGARGWTSNRLTADDASNAAVEELAGRFYPALKDRDGNAAQGPVRMLEKTPKNALRVPFFAKAWPDARFVYLYRDVRPTLASMMEAWASGRFRTYPRLPGWDGPAWSLLLVPGWQEMNGLPLNELVAHQWARTTEALLDDLSALPPEQVVALDYQQFLDAPQDMASRLAATLGLEWDLKLTDVLPYSKVTVTPPSAHKWRKLESAIEPTASIFGEADEKARAFVAARSSRLKA